VDALFASALEHGIIEQMQPGTSAISTVNILREANKGLSGQKLFLAKLSNWAAIKPQLVGAAYTSANGVPDLGEFTDTNGNGIRDNGEPWTDRPIRDNLEWLINNKQAQLFLPANGTISQGIWKGSGWVIRSTDSVGMIISGGYSGGYGTSKRIVQSPAITTSFSYNPVSTLKPSSVPVQSAAPAVSTQRNYAADPVDMASGAFVFAAEDMATGIEGAPRGLAFARNYSSNMASRDEQNLGYGWMHNFHIRAVARTASDEALGMGSPQQAAAFLAAVTAASDLYRKDATPKEWGVAALAVGWFVDQMKDNAVSVRMGKDIFQFIKQPDGTFTAPPGSTMILTKATDATYRLQQRLGNTIEFDAAGKATKIVDVDGRAMTFQYNANGTLNFVQDAGGRSYTFGYNGTHITSVADSTSPTRSVTFGYDTTNWNLTSATDPEGKVSYFDYSVAGDPGGTTAGQHRIVRLRNHDNETITQNVWDSLGRVERQFLHGDTNKTFRLYYTGRENFEVNPQGGITRYFYDERGRAAGSRDPEGHANFMTYDGQDRVVTRTTGANETTAYTYDAAHNLTRIDHPRGGGSTLMAYDNLNRLDLVTDPNGAQTDYVYFGSGADAAKDRPQSVIAAKGTAEQTTTTYAYTASGAAIGRVATITDGDGLVTTKTYDALGQPDITTLPGGFSLNENYSAQGNLDSVVDANGRTTSFTYNKRRQRTGETADTAGVAATANAAFDNQARVATVTAPADNAGQRPQQSLTYNPTDKVRLKKLNNVTVEETAYDSRDWASTAKDAANRTTTFVRKANGDLAETQRPSARKTKFFYDGDSRVTSTQSPGANSGPRNEGFVYDTTSGGKPRTVKTEADGRTVTSEYDAAGRLRFVTDRKGAKFEFRYDELGRRTQVVTPTGAATTTAYTKNGRAASVTEASGDKTTFNYSATTGRLASAVHAGTGGATVNYTGYDANGNLLSVNEGGNGTITRTYDGLNRVTSYTEAGKTIGYRYYASGKLAKVIYPGGTETGVGHIEYTYNADGRLYQVIDRLSSTATPRTTTYVWNTDGRLATVTRPNGTVRTISYDAAGRPSGISDAGIVWGIGYYASDDIATLDVTPAVTPQSLAAVPATQMTFDTANRLATFNGQSVTHDADGNMVSGPLPATGAMGNYTYDSRNRLTGAGGFAYRYNAEGNRVGLTSANETTTLTVDPQGALPKVLERVKNGIRTRYVYGAGLQYEVNDAGAATYYHYDQSGNTAALTNQSGAIIERVVYSPYGTIRYRQSNFDTPFLYGGFFGVMTDANGLINMRARYYNPLTMRFLNSDPAMDGLNWYAYAGGNPINFADPTGYGASRVLDAMQGGLTALGFAPGVGAVADLVNAGISAGRGDFVGAGFNLASSLPGLGDAFAAGKIATAAVGVAVAKSASHAVSSTAATAAKVEAAVVKEGALDNAAFAQKTFSQTFSSGGKFAGQSIDDVAGALRSGAIKPADVPIEYIVRDGNTLMLNTRSAQALQQAGIPRSSWNAINMTGNAAAEARLAGQLQRNGLTSQGILNPTGN
jgi:RHS repeat-associated protein